MANPFDNPDVINDIYESLKDNVKSGKYRGRNSTVEFKNDLLNIINQYTKENKGTDYDKINVNDPEHAKRRIEELNIPFYDLIQKAVDKGFLEYKIRFPSDPRSLDKGLKGAAISIRATRFEENFMNKFYKFILKGWTPKVNRSFHSDIYEVQFNQINEDFLYLIKKARVRDLDIREQEKFAMIVKQLFLNDFTSLEHPENNYQYFIKDYKNNYISKRAFDYAAKFDYNKLYPVKTYIEIIEMLTDKGKIKGFKYGI